MEVTNTSIKCNTIVYDNICGTKCNTIVVTVLGLILVRVPNVTILLAQHNYQMQYYGWYNPGNSSLLWPSFSDHHMHFQVVCLSIPSVPMLCLEDPLIGNDTIHLEHFLMVRMVC